ncbi:hypothetical protein T492DRAFT_951695 [Pavlovales sp. CCMP2436]|nr:hypothetical protein T492DRAFT_951695 [Pavlovales sp. CCMP2436]
MKLSDPDLLQTAELLAYLLIIYLFHVGPALDPAAAVTPGPHGAKSPGTHQLATTSAVAAARTEGDSGAFSEPAKVAQAYRFSWEAMTQRESRAI